MLDSPHLLCITQIVGIGLLFLFGYLGSYGTFRLVVIRLPYLWTAMAGGREPRWVRLSLGAVAGSAVTLSMAVAWFGAGVYISILVEHAAVGLCLGILYRYLLTIYRRH